MKANQEGVLARLIQAGIEAEGREAILSADEIKSLKEKQELRLREQFAIRAYSLVKGWSWFLALLTVVQFIGHRWGMGLSDWDFRVVFSIGTSAAFGFWYLVGKYLFYKVKAPSTR